MGGQTIRQLEKLLQIGDYNERKQTKDDLSGLFVGQGRLIENLITISTPHLGSPLFDIFTKGFTDKIKDTVIKIGNAFNKNSFMQDFYNMDIDQFCLEREVDETDELYKLRIDNHPIWKTDYKDISSYDLSPKGAEEFNNASSEVYQETKYLAVATYMSYEFMGFSVVSPFMLPWLMFTGFLMGWNGHNDGMVPLSSSRGPGKSILLKPDNTVSCAVWYTFDVYLDHMQVLGTMTIYNDRINDTYSKIKAFIETG